ncbi:MAG: mannitol dehydrogenase family protein, partial [Muribaculaceae bacterium]|nr:mannitol dehydrogenase family protein [Muribaculaceae bacterium]
ELNRQNGSHDLAPMVCEDYARWVVEDDFAAGRPALERVGVEFVNDVTDYDNMRYGFDEAARLMLAYPAYIAGYRKVDHAVHDCRFRTLLRDFLEKDAGACISIPPQVDAEAYRNGLLERFSNAEVCESLAGVCSGGLSRMSVSIVPTLGEMLKRGMDTSRIAYLMAACRHYLKYRTDDDGRTFSCDEPAMTDSVRPLVESDDPLDFLRLPVFASLPLVSSESFRKEFLDSAEAIERYGAMRALEYII